jgi:hypothetical protein
VHLGVGGVLLLWAIVHAGQPATTQSAAALSAPQLGALLTLEFYRQAISEAQLPESRKQAALAFVETHRVAIENVKARDAQDAARQVGMITSQVVLNLGKLFADDESYAEVIYAADAISEQAALIVEDPGKLLKEVDQLSLSDEQRRAVTSLFDQTRDELRQAKARYEGVKSYSPDDDGLAPIKLQQVGFSARGGLMQILSGEQRTALTRTLASPDEPGR